jgi:hypothetical protein
MVIMQRYISHFKEDFNLDNLIEQYKLKESGNNIAATSMESFYNMVNMYKELERTHESKNKRKLLKTLKRLLTDFVTMDSLLAKEFNYKGIAGTHYR